MRAAASLLFACGLMVTSPAWAQVTEPLRVATVVVGDPGPEARVRLAVAAHTLPDVSLQLVELPDQRAPVSELSDLDASLIAARRQYLEADGAACVATVEAALDLERRLGQGDRLGVSRALSWLIACELARAEEATARTWARRFSVLGLELPAELDGPISPDVAELIVEQSARVRAAEPVPLRVLGRFAHGSVILDGDARCSPPCAFDVASGDHVLRLSADGVVPSVRTVRVDEGGAEVSFDPEPAGPTVAASQWNAHYRGSAAVESAASVRLLSRALRRPHLALLVAERQGERVDLRAVFVEDEEVRRRASAQGDASNLTPAVGAILAELLIDHLPPPAPPFYEEAWFWTLVGLVVAGGVTAAILGTQIQPTRRVRVVFGP